MRLFQIIREPCEASALRSPVGDFANNRGSSSGLLLNAAAALLFAVAYSRVLCDAVSLWRRDENYTHGFLIAPLIGFLIWRRRAEIAAAAAADRPLTFGVVLVIVGLTVMVLSQTFQIPYAGYWSLPVTVAGAILALAGRRVWQILCFPTMYALVAAPIPDFVLGPISGQVQRWSSTGAAALMKGFGYTLALHGNLIELPGMTLEVADVCSGFKKMIALVAFALLYGYLCRAALWKRVALVAAAVPIAVTANILRIGGLIAVASAGGDSAVKVAHDYAELVAIIIACTLFLGLGRALECQKSLVSDLPSSAA